MSLPHPKAPAHSHPLSPLLSRGRRSREPPRSDSKNATSCLTLNAQPEQLTSSCDGSGRGYSKLNKYSGARRKDHPSSGDDVGASVFGSSHGSHVINVLQSQQYSQLAIAHVLNTKWHKCSNDAIEDAISMMISMEESDSVVNHSYFTALRILSSAYSSMVHAWHDSQEYRRLVLEKETARKQRADDLLCELQPSEMEVARRVIQSIFTNDDEHSYGVQRQQSNRVCYCCSLHDFVIELS